MIVRHSRLEVNRADLPLTHSKVTERVHERGVDPPALEGYLARQI